jgi:hypothetical protein
MLPYFFITNRTNYSRWMPVYILDMLEHRYFYEIQTAHSRTLMVVDRCSQRSYTSSNNKTLVSLENGDAVHHLHSNTGICFWWRFKLCCQMYEQNGRVIGRHDVCLMENSPFSKADFISAGSSSISSIYTGIHLE